MKITLVGDDTYEANAKSFIAAMKTLSNIPKERIEGAERVANEYATKGVKYIVTDYEGVAGVVGLMILKECEEDNCFKIEDICTHPCTKGVGRKLVEHAVNVSYNYGYMGQLKIADMSGSDFYDKLGFESPTSDIRKVLEPLKSGKWRRGSIKGLLLNEYPSF